MDVEKSYFHGVLEKLNSATHPEVFHFRNGNHPGPNWYLKTVCPMPKLRQIDKIGYGNLWDNIAMEHPNDVLLVPHAYDWLGKEIPYMASIWLSVESDVIIKMDSLSGLNIVLVDRAIGNEYHVETLKKLIEFSRSNVEEIDNIAIDELEQIEEIANLLERELKSESAIQIRNDFTVMDGGKNKEE